MNKEAMKLALEALEYIRNIDTEVSSQIKYGNAAQSIEEALAKRPAQQEPVVLPCCGFTDARAVRWNFYNKVVQCHNCGQVYTSPPAQRTWVGLSDAEIHNMTILMGFNPEWVAEVGIVKSIVRNLEAKLKEKNNG